MKVTIDIQSQIVNQAWNEYQELKVGDTKFIKMVLESLRDLIKEHKCHRCEKPMMLGPAVTVSHGYASIADGDEYSFCSDDCYSQYRLDHKGSVD